MTAPTHLLIHRYRIGTGPQAGTPEYEEEIRQWDALGTRMEAEGVLTAGYAIHERGALHRADSDGQAHREDLDTGQEIVFAIHAVSLDSDAEAEALASTMPHLQYGSVEVRPLMLWDDSPS